MSSRRYEEDPSRYDQYKPHQAQHRARQNDRMHEAGFSKSESRSYRQRSASPPRRYVSPHDHHRFLRDGNASGHQVSSTQRNLNHRTQRNYYDGYDNNERDRSLSPREPRGRGYRNRYREGHRSPGYSRSRSRSRSRSLRRDRSPYYGGPPSREVMLEGLPLDMVEDDISKELKQYHNVDHLDDVRIIRDRQTKVSRGFGFLRFPSIEESKVFVERYYPMIYLYGNSASGDDDQAAKIRIAFSRERDERTRNEKSDGEWTCKICTFLNYPSRTKCLRCHTPQIDMSMVGVTGAPKPPEFLNIGDSDASLNGSPSQFILLRGLEPTVTEELLAKGVAKLFKPNRRAPSPTTVGSKRPNAKVISTTGDVNLGAKEGSLRRVLLVRDRRSNESWRYGFAEFSTVEDAQAALIRYNSFDKFTISSKPVTVDYIHAGVFVPVFNPTEETEKYTFCPLGNPATRLEYWDKEAWVSELVVSSSLPEQPAATDDLQARSTSDIAASAAENEGLLKSNKESDLKGKKRKAEPGESTKQKSTAPAHLQFWSNRHAELHGKKSESTNVTDIQERSEKDTISDTVVDEVTTLPRSFAHPSKKCCYLCSRQFQTVAEVNKHERLSKLHSDNLMNKHLIDKATARLAKEGVLSRSDDTNDYRDRAKERRAAFGASKKTSLPLKKPTADPEPQVNKDDDFAPTPSKGASLLSKMGWSAGEGLGAQGTGKIAPVVTDMYMQGVGLGAQGGKIGDAADVADRNTKGDYGEFLERTRDKAKERYEKMV